ncbi:DUF4374 domain-containing protein [Mesonia algae]|nr:DUF4374 domain-containing protein [Mesonia algae]
MRKLNFYFLTIIAMSLVMVSCSDDDISSEGGEGSENPDAISKYVITASPLASEGVADYILTSSSLTEGEISVVGNGVEQDGTYRYYITNNNKFFSLLYGQGNPGAVTTYQLGTDGNLDMISDFQAETVQSFTNVGDEVLMTKISRNTDSPYADWYRLDTETSQIVGEGQINTQEIVADEELAFFSWMTEVGGKVYAPFMPIKGCCDDSFGTSNPDKAYVAVYSYPEMELETLIEDERTSFIGRYFTSGLEVDENGDAYAFSSSIASTAGEFSSTKPSAITRINAGTTEFDQSYFFNLEQASGGYYVTAQKYASNGKFVVFMEPNATKGSYTLGKKIAIVDVYTQEFNWVTGTPSAEAITNITSNNYTSEDGSTVHIGITTDQGSYVYNVNVSAAQATQGILVEGGNITAISKLSSVEQN